jgi:hypothetical protein
MPGSGKRRVDLRGMFLGLQEKMILTLRMAKENVWHKTIVGDATELCWLEMLETYLPRRYQAAKAVVLDSRGQTSDQIDIVIFDRQYSPFLFESKGVTYVPAESVYCVIEVKQLLARTTLMEAGWKAASVRGLHRTSAPIPHAGGVYKARELFTILGGFVALDGPPEGGLGRGFADLIEGLTKETRVDLGCVLRAAAFEIEYQTDKSEIRNAKSETNGETGKRLNSKPEGNAETEKSEILSTKSETKGKRTNEEIRNTCQTDERDNVKSEIRNAKSETNGETGKRLNPKPEMQNANDSNKGDVKPVIKTSGREEALIFFFLSLLERLQGLATVPAMMFGEYKRALRKG